MIDTKKTLKSATFILFICLFVVAFFCVAPYIEKSVSTSIFVVTFDTGVGDDIVINVLEHNTIVKPEEPRKPGYTFKGWYYGNDEYDFTTEVTKNMKLKAIWEKNKEDNNNVTYTVTFDSNGGSIVDKQIVKAGDVVVITNEPVREGYTFVEWQLDGVRYDFSQSVLKDIVLVAVWEEN